MLNILLEECRKRNIKGISMHARIDGGLAYVVERYLSNIAKISEKRVIEAWPYYNPVESTMYIEAEEDSV